VPGGWLVRAISWAIASRGIALTFYPDPDGEWEL